MKRKSNREYEVKTMPAWVKSISGRSVVGITAVMGNVDDGGDRILQGAFAKTLSESKKRIRHLWQHGADGWDYGVTPPIAKIARIEEVGREGLPQEVLDAAPDATGGLEVEREYLDTERGNEILAAYSAGIELEMSIGYNAIQVRYIEDDGERVTKRHWRDLIEIRLFDTSDVNWGMNSATVGSKTSERRLSLLIDRMAAIDEEIKAGRIDSQELIDQFLALCKKISSATLPEETQPAEIESRAEPHGSLKTDSRISLTQSLKRLHDLEIASVS